MHFNHFKDKALLAIRHQYDHKVISIIDYIKFTVGIEGSNSTKEIEAILEELMADTPATALFLPQNELCIDATCPEGHTCDEYTGACIEDSTLPDVEKSVWTNTGKAVIKDGRAFPVMKNATYTPNEFGVMITDPLPVMHKSPFGGITIYDPTTQPPCIRLNMGEELRNKQDIKSGNSVDRLKQKETYENALAQIDGDAFLQRTKIDSIRTEHLIGNPVEEQINVESELGWMAVKRWGGEAWEQKANKLFEAGQEYIPIDDTYYLQKIPAAIRVMKGKCPVFWDEEDFVKPITK